MSIEAMKQALDALDHSRPNQSTIPGTEYMNQLWATHYMAKKALRVAILHAECDKLRVDKDKVQPMYITVDRQMIEDIALCLQDYRQGVEWSSTHRKCLEELQGILSLPVHKPKT